MTSPNQNTLGDMLRYMRPHGSEAERAFNTKFLDNIKGMESDKLGNRWLQVGSGCPIIWSSHTDTVHFKSGVQDVSIKSAVKDRAIAISNSNCLGADCTTGVFIMKHMIDNSVPGLYIFHASEEAGCIGSKALVAANKPMFSKNYKAAVAFDRKGTKDVITHQLGRRTCSDKFAASFAKLLGKGYKGDDGGVYTDTAHYADCVSECTNISVGYYNQHTSQEWQDIEHVLWLADQMTKINLDELVFERDPTKKETSTRYGYGGYSSGGYGYYRNGKYVRARYKDPDMWDFCKEYPYSAANFMEAMGFTLADMKEWCKDNNKHVYSMFEWE